MANLCTPVGSSISKEEWEKALALAEDCFKTRADDAGTLARAFRHLKICYDELVRMNQDAPRPEALPPTGWIITKGDRIHHYSMHDGWKLEVVTSSGPQKSEGSK